MVFVKNWYGAGSHCLVSNAKISKVYMKNKQKTKKAKERYRGLTIYYTTQMS